MEQGILDHIEFFRPDDRLNLFHKKPPFVEKLFKIRVLFSKKPLSKPWASTGVLSIKKLLSKYPASIGVISYFVAVKRTPSLTMRFLKIQTSQASIWKQFLLSSTKLPCSKIMRLSASSFTIKYIIKASYKSNSVYSAPNSPAFRRSLTPITFSMSPLLIKVERGVCFRSIKRITKNPCRTVGFDRGLSIKKLLPKHLASIGVISYDVAVGRTPSP